jgi:magnesium transporter
VEDLLEYYLQRASGTQSEAERQLEGARDLEESIGVSLSARRYEVNRLELMLSMGSFAAAVGAMVAGIFGMNMKSTLEFSVAGFWGVTLAIVLGCCYMFVAIMRYTQRRKIL